MSSVVETRIRPSTLSFRVLQMAPERATPRAAANAVRLFLQRKRPGLAQALEIEAAAGAVVLRASGEAPGEMLREAVELLESAKPSEAEDQIAVDPAEFVIRVDDASPPVGPEREVLRSRVRYFPHPVCEWFEISTGELTLSDHRIVYEPEWAIMWDETAQESGQHLIPLASVLGVERGEWWDIPCLMIKTPEVTYRYGWPATRYELELIFDVGEWLERLRDLLRDR